MNEMPPDMPAFVPGLVFFIPLAGIALTGFIVWIVVAAWRHRTETRAAAEFNTRLLERISSFKDFSDFVQTEQGAKMMRGLPTELHSAGPRDRLLRAVSSGVIITSLGVGVLVMTDIMESIQLLFIGGVTLALGIGLLLSAAVSYFVAKSLGALEPRARGERLD